MYRFHLLLAAVLTPLLVAQQAQVPVQDARFKIKVQSATVVVDVIVTDGKGNVIPGLTAADFQVFENKAPQKILSFDPPALGATAAEARPGEPAPAVIAGRPAAKTGSFRMITLVIDQSAMRGPSLKASIDAATQYVERAIGAEDYVAVYSVGSTLRLVVSFSRDKQKIIEGIQSLNRSNQGIQTGRDRDRNEKDLNELNTRVQSLRQSGDQMDGMLAQMLEVERLTLQAEMGMFATMQTRALFRALRAVALSSGTLPGRKNVVLFSEGLPATTETDAGVSSVIDAANRANVAFYIIDPSGLTQTDFMGNFDSGAVSNGTRGTNTRAARDLANASRGTQVEGGETKFDQLFKMSADGGRDGLRVVADRTGGLMIKNKNDLKSSLDRIDRDLREFYTLTYQPENPEYDGSYREIRVEVAGHHNIRYRKGYYALAPGDEIKVTPASAQMLASVTNGTLHATIKPKVTAAMVFSSPTELSIPISILLPGEQSWVTKTDKGFGSNITMLVTARDNQGHIVDVFQKFVDARWSKDEWKAVEKKGLQVLATLTVPKLEPLEIQAIFQFSGGAAALGTVKLPIPGGETGARLTSLFLTPRVDVTPEVRDGDPEALHIAGYQLSVPAEMRFSASDKLTLYFGMDGVSIVPETGSPRINLALALKSGDKVIKELSPDTLYPWPHSKNRIFFLNQFDLAGLPPGSYTVQATLKDLATKTTTVNGADFSIQ